VQTSDSPHGHLARQLALKTVKAMIHNDWTKCNDNIKQISGVCWAQTRFVRYLHQLTEGGQFPCNPKKKKKKKNSGVCSSWLRGKDPSMTLAAFQSLWCHNGILSSVTSPTGDVDGRLELQLHLSATCPVLLFFYCLFFFFFCGLQGNCPPSVS